MKALRTDWSAEFFRRFYVDEQTRIVKPGELFWEGHWLGHTLVGRLAVLLDSPVDLGSGTGEFADGLDDALERWTPRAEGVAPITVRRVDLYAEDPRAERHDVRSIDFRRHDLIVCRDLLHYLEESSTSALLLRINNSGAKALYLRVTTEEDRRARRSDDEIALRSVRWYRSRLSEYVGLSCGIFVKRDQAVALARCEWP